MSAENKLNAGSVLVASPQLKDPAFEKAVVLILGHEPEIESRGITLSQHFAVAAIGVLKQTYNLDLLGHLPSEQQVLYKGGPLGTDQVLLLVSDRATGPKSAAPIGETGFSFSPLIMAEEGIKTFADVVEAKPETALLALGYASWGAGQLKQEIDLGMWAVANMDLRTLFNAAPEKRWEVAARAAGYETGSAAQKLTDSAGPTVP